MLTLLMLQGWDIVVCAMMLISDNLVVHAFSGILDTNCRSTCFKLTICAKLAIVMELCELELAMAWVNHVLLNRTVE